MKRLLLLLILSLFLQDSVAQKVSPYYPTPSLGSSNNQFETQITYFDLNFVNSKIQEFLSRKLEMTLQGDSNYNLDGGKGTISESYLDKISINKEPRKMTFSFEVFPVEGELVVKTLKITGDTDAVLDFFVRYWSTNLNFDDVKRKEVVSNRYLQDRISFTFNEGNSTIEVQNTTIKDDEKFVAEFLSKKKKEQEQKVSDREMMPKYSKEAKKVEKVFSYNVLKKKRRLKYEQYDGYFKDTYAEKGNLDQKLEKFMADKKDGNYIIDVKYAVQNDKLKGLSFEVQKFQKPKGFLGTVNDVLMN
ncbi:MAG: hypothetical protein ABGW97_15950 [Christiangramia sp.]|uniref:hypothetical protein n=1 Tax=Christiangramia sp. TaxID=1931228 RepID=UPI00324288C0